MTSPPRYFTRSATRKTGADSRTNDTTATASSRRLTPARRPISPTMAGWGMSHPLPRQAAAGVSVTEACR
uniref:hypothetical protein n=1 Tax=Nonomuraea pusilla TaxID=46177 RepID=UPI0006E43837|nr:hypothetical protein [Nonomuraea pusilla]